MATTGQAFKLDPPFQSWHASARPGWCQPRHHERIILMVGCETDQLGLFISIPFCRSKCTYCNFASGVYPASDHARYVERVIEDLRAAAGWAADMGAEP